MVMMVTLRKICRNMEADVASYITIRWAGSGRGGVEPLLLKPAEQLETVKAIHKVPKTKQTFVDTPLYSSHQGVFYGL